MKASRSSKKTSGFTLVELIVVCMPQTICFAHASTPLHHPFARRPSCRLVFVIYFLSTLILYQERSNIAAPTF